MNTKTPDTVELYLGEIWKQGYLSGVVLSFLQSLTFLVTFILYCHTCDCACVCVYKHMCLDTCLFYFH